MIQLWVFDDDRQYLDLCTAALLEAGFEVIAFDTAETVAREIGDPAARPPDGAVLDIQVGNAGDNRGLQLAGGIKDRWPSVQVFFMTSYAHGEKEHVKASDYQAHFISKHAGDARQVLVRQIRAWVPEDRKEWRHVGSLSIHRPGRRFFWRREEVDLDHSEKEIVLLLTQWPGTVFTYEQIRENTGIGRFAREDLEEDDPPERADELLKNLVQKQIGKIRSAFKKAELRFSASHSTVPVDFDSVLETENKVGYRWNKL